MRITNINPSNLVVRLFLLKPNHMNGTEALFSLLTQLNVSVRWSCPVRFSPPLDHLRQLERPEP